MRLLTRLISDMSKYTILVILLVTLSFLWTVVVCIVVIEANDVFVGQSIARFFESCLVLTNCICLVLQFEFAKKNYQKMCSGLHKICENRYTKGINQKNKNSQLQRLPSGEFGFKTNGASSTDFELAVDDKENNDNNSNSNNNNTENNDINGAGITLIAQKSVETLHA